jgi:aminopeptidase Y
MLIDENIKLNSSGSQSVVIVKKIYKLAGLLILFTITTIALAAATLGIVVNRLESNKNYPDKSGPVSLVDQIKIDDLMKHLEQLQVFADRSSGTRAIATSGFNDTLDYITTQLEQNTNLIIQHQYFTVRNYIIQGTPQLQTRINGNIDNRTYLTDFAPILFSSRADFDSFVPVVAIPNFGCSDADWTSVSATGAVALVIRGNCAYVEKSALAEKYQVKGLLIYNDGLAPGNFQPIQGVRNNFNTTIPAYFLSYDLGIQLANATVNSSVMMNIDVSDAEGIGNICADTPSGNKTKTIVIGSHSDSVPAGSGINDNGKKTLIC